MAWRGAAPVQHAVLHGDELTGASVFALEEGLDTGPVYATLIEPIRSTDTSGDLLDRLAVAGAALLVDVLDAIDAGAARAVPQPAEGVSLAPKLSVPDAQVRWDHPAFAVARQIRACTPAPGAWTTLRGERLKLGPVTPAGPPDVVGSELVPGEVAVQNNRVLVGTGTEPVHLGQVQAAGKKPMPAQAWVRGVRFADRERLGD